MYAFYVCMCVVCVYRFPRMKNAFIELYLSFHIVFFKTKCSFCDILTDRLLRNNNLGHMQFGNYIQNQIQNLLYNMYKFLIIFRTFAHQPSIHER